jgi:hypothetical protein
VFKFFEYNFPAGETLPAAVHRQAGLLGGHIDRLWELKRSRSIFLASSRDAIEATIIFSCDFVND